MSSEASDDPYSRGVAAGEIGARLAGHDKHFATINGSISGLRDEMHLLTLAVQRLGDAMDNDRKTVVTTASALKDAETARRDKGEQSWSPWAKMSTTVGALAAFVGLVAGLYALLKRG